MTRAGERRGPITADEVQKARALEARPGDQTTVSRTSAGSRPPARPRSTPTVVS